MKRLPHSSRFSTDGCGESRPDWLLVTSKNSVLWYRFRMPRRLHRYYGAGYLHFITTSCYQRRALLRKKQNRDLFLQVLEQVRRRYHFAVVGYVVMPEHVHLLLGEPERRNPSVVMQALKQGFARRLLRNMKSRDSRQACGETLLHASESGKTRTRARTATVGMEQFSTLRVRRARCRSRKRATKGQTSRAANRLIPSA
jgi:REP element-mobilizing transposase RayT